MPEPKPANVPAAGFKRQRSVVVVPYDAAWPSMFAAARDQLAQVVPEAISIEHIGSTSVPGLSSKPTVDVLMVVDDIDIVLHHVEDLAAISFEHRPGAFAPERRHLFFRRMDGAERSHHLHVVEARSHEPDDYRVFRDWLRANPEAAVQYEAIKLELAERFADQRDRYVASKEPLVEALLIKARSWQTRDA